MRNGVKILGIIVMLLLGQAPTEIAVAISLAECTKDSDPSPLTFINPVACGTYGEVTTRTSDPGQPIVIRFMKHVPAGTPKAVAVLFAGGNLNTGIQGNAATGVLTAAGANFLVRSAQIFADDGILAIALNRPLILTAPGPPPVFDPEYPGESGAAADRYRISPKHAFDIVRTLAVAAPATLPLFLVGTSRGTLSAAANHALGNGILLSSPVTSGTLVNACPAPGAPCPPYWIGHPSVPELAPGGVARPAHVMAHKQDGCPVTVPSDAEALHITLKAAGVDTRFDQVNGGFDLVGIDPLVDVCDAKTHHGYLGMENKAVREITKRIDELLGELRRRFRNNQRPVAGTSTIIGAPFTVSLPSLVTNPDGDPLTFALPNPQSYRGQDLALSATGTVTYTPPAAPPVGFTDGFVYVVSDGKGGISAGYVTVSLR